MKKLYNILFMLLFSPHVLAGNNSMSVDEIIQSTVSDPIDKSIPLVSVELRKKEIFIPRLSKDSNNSNQFLTGLDNEGNVWLYIYSDKKHVSKIFPDGTAVGIVNFQGLEDIVLSNKMFRGIYLNSVYPIPREMFKLFFQ